MTEQLTVTSQPTADRAGSIREVIASLPISLSRSTSPEPDLVAVTGTTGWTNRAIEAIRAGARGVLVIDPQPEPVHELKAVAIQREVPVVLNHRLASNPGVEVARRKVQSISAEISYVDLTAAVDPWSTSGAALEELRLIASKLVGRVQGLRTLRHNESVSLASGYCAGTSIPVTLAALHAPLGAFAAQARIVTANGDIELRIPSPETAAPAEVTFTDAEGTTLAPTLYESSRRSSWRRLIGFVDGRSQPTDLDEFAMSNGV